MISVECSNLSGFSAIGRMQNNDCFICQGNASTGMYPRSLFFFRVFTWREESQESVSQQTRIITGRSIYAAESDDHLYVSGTVLK